MKSKIIKLQDISTVQRKQLAELVGTSDDTLRHVQSGHRQASAWMAGLIERAARRIGLTIRRESLCEACKNCNLAKKARKSE